MPHIQHNIFSNATIGNPLIGMRYKSLTLTQEGNQAVATLTVYCPTHGDQVVTHKVPIPLNQEMNVNGYYSYTMPCGDSVGAYLAVHKTKGVEDLSFRISNIPIAVNWWSGA